MKTTKELTRDPKALFEAFKQAATRVAAPKAAAFDAENLVDECPVCGGLGVHGVNVPINHPLFGKSFSCREPHCRAGYERYVAIIRRHFGTSGLPADFFTSSDYRVYTFPAWELLSSEQLSGKRTGYSVCRQIAEGSGQPFTVRDALALDWEKFPEVPNDFPRRGVVLTGDVGVGKTSLAMATAARCVELQIPVLYTRLDNLIAKIQETYDPDSEVRTDVLIDLAESVTVLILDEFNLHKMTDDRLEKLESIIRMRDAHHLRTMATTNLTLDEFYKKWGDRIADIMAKSHWISMGGVKLRNTVYESLRGF